MQHLHEQFIEGCFKCELNLDEMPDEMKLHGGETMCESDTVAHYNCKATATTTFLFESSQKLWLRVCQTCKDKLTKHYGSVLG